MTGISEGLVSAYMKTKYVVNSPNPFELQIATPSLAADKLLEGYGVEAATIITAFNPFSQLKSVEANQKANALLLQQLKEMKLASFPTEAIDPDGEWPIELGFFVMGLTQAEAIKLCNLYRQNAVVWHQKGKETKVLSGAGMFLGDG
ncbi:MAG: DUF3293 domain-containing protein [Alphaproteobacteria bacterium]|nr:DUF3293 domain-containing protein [Alphaproteobacteria bacterium]